MKRKINSILLKLITKAINIEEATDMLVELTTGGKELDPWQVRVVEEFTELREKIVKLTNYLSNSNNKTDGALHMQLFYMKEYAEILEKRIELF